VSRTLATKGELLGILNAEMATRSGCQGCHFSGIRRLRRPDLDGCDWMPSSLTCAHLSPESCKEPCRSVVAEAREKYNLR
jgi:hypothetical protein